MLDLSWFLPTPYHPCMVYLPTYGWFILMVKPCKDSYYKQSSHGKSMRWVGIKCYKPIGSTPGFAKHLLLGRFPKRKAVHPSDVDDAALKPMMRSATWWFSPSIGGRKVISLLGRCGSFFWLSIPDKKKNVVYLPTFRGVKKVNKYRLR